MNTLSGILAIILGILVIAFPIFSVFTVSVLAGLGVIFIGIWLLSLGFGAWSQSKGLGIAYLIMGILAVFVGMALFGNILALSFLASFWLYFGGFFLIIAGVMGFFAREHTVHKGSNALIIVMDYMNYFEETFAMGIQSGEFIPHNVKTSAITLMAALDGILSYMIFDENLVLEEVVKHFQEKFIKPVEAF